MTLGNNGFRSIIFIYQRITVSQLRSTGKYEVCLQWLTTLWDNYDASLAMTLPELKLQLIIARAYASIEEMKRWYTARKRRSEIPSLWRWWRRSSNKSRAVDSRSGKRIAGKSAEMNITHMMTLAEQYYHHRQLGKGVTAEKSNRQLGTGILKNPWWWFDRKSRMNW